MRALKLGLVIIILGLGAFSFFRGCSSCGVIAAYDVGARCVIDGAWAGL